MIVNTFPWSHCLKIKIDRKTKNKTKTKLRKQIKAGTSVIIHNTANNETAMLTHCGSKLLGANYQCPARCPSLVEPWRRHKENVSCWCHGRVLLTSCRTWTSVQCCGLWGSWPPLVKISLLGVEGGGGGALRDKKLEEVGRDVARVQWGGRAVCFLRLHEC